MQARTSGNEWVMWVATGVFALLIGYFALIPVTPRSMAIPDDKLMHVVAFAVLVLPLSLIHARKAMFIFVGAVAYGLLIEVVQPYMGRFFELADLWADAIGAAIGIGLGAVLSGVVQRIRQA